MKSYNGKVCKMLSTGAAVCTELAYTTLPSCERYYTFGISMEASSHRRD